MIRIWMACLLVVVAASPAAPQTRVRLQVEVESWLDPTPFEAFKEFTAKLNQAGIEVSDDLDAPVVYSV